MIHTPRFRTRAAASGLALLLLTAAPGCSDQTEGGGDGGQGPIQCEPGFVPIGGECRRVAGEEPEPQPEAEPNPNAEPEPDPNAEPDPDAEPEPEAGGCIQGQSRCADINTLERCDAAATWIPEPCQEGTLCDDGSCRSPNCDPGSVLGCSGQYAQAICNETGTGVDTRTCPDGLSCLDGECTDQICIPGAISCSGPTTTRICNEAGDGYDPGQECGPGTACDGDRCKSLCEINAKVTSYLGCDYWSLDLDNVESGQVQPHAIVVSNPSPDLVAEITITRADGTVENFPNRQVAPGGLEVYLMPNQYGIDGSGVFTGNAWRIDASIPVTAHQFNPLNGEAVFTNDASLLLPSNSTDREYLAMSWKHRGDGFNNISGFVTVIAIEEGTTSVTVRPTAATMAGPGVPALAVNQTHTLTLNQGQVLSLSTSGPQGADLTGTSVTADKKIAVFGGHECANVPEASINYCDHVEQQIFPLSSWGNRYIAVPFKPRNGRQVDTWTIMGGADGVTVNTSPPQSINGITLSRGQKVQFTANQPFEIVASGPVLVGQFMHGSNYTGFEPSPACCPEGTEWDPNQRCCADIFFGFCGLGDSTGIGDPAFTLAVPVAQFRQDYIVLTPTEYVEDYMNIIAPTGTTVTLDGRPIGGLLPMGNSGFSTVQLPVPDGTHRLQSDQPFGLVAYGYDCDVSYAYPGGLNLQTLRR